RLLERAEHARARQRSLAERRVDRGPALEGPAEVLLGPLLIEGEEAEPRPGTARRAVLPVDVQRRRQPLERARPLAARAHALAAGAVDGAVERRELHRDLELVLGQPELVARARDLGPRDPHRDVARRELLRLLEVVPRRLGVALVDQRARAADE